MKATRNKKIFPWFCLLPGQPDTLTEADLLSQIVVAETPVAAVLQFVADSLSEGTLAQDASGALIRLRKYNKPPIITVRAFWGIRVQIVKEPQ